jgi:two-component system nitrate/nitrite response regulator NarL
MTKTQKIRILIADDFRSLRDMIRLHLARSGDMDVIGEALELDQALERAKQLQPDVIIRNDYLPPVDSALAAALFREEGITAAILVISKNAESALIQRSFQSGVNGFMNIDEIEELLADAIRSVSQGKRYLSPKAQKATVDRQV